MSESLNDHPEKRGLFGGFEGHRVADDSAANAALSSALISLDANVLLGLYRYPDEFSSEFIDALSRLNDRVFVSDQAVTEFWRNRISASADRGRARKEVEERLAAYHRNVRDALSQWAKKTALDDDELGQALEGVARQFEVLNKTVADNHSDDVERYPSPSRDPIVQRLESLLDGRVGAALTLEEYSAAVEEGKRRHKEQMPPGYKENAKNKEHLPEGVAGDYLVWLQSVREAEQRKLDLMIVTADEKEDWYWRLRETVIGPRPELAKEFWDMTGRQLFMSTPLEFLRRYKDLGGDVSEAALAEAERQTTPQETAREPEGRQTTAVWTPSGVSQLLSRLDVEAPVQAAVIREAAENGGIIDRERVFEIGEYGPSRMLRGFTRPVSRITRSLQASGVVDLEVPEMLRPRYDYGVQANAFQVPDEVVRILTEPGGGP
ncbi:PIN-like domain-containing protein [Actinoplanes sp. NPDC049596]|uniref:PIN-like domain-containing protein n=1 Tax=unclassified Actinoplanes TaxID=2626549 RepID=UPI0034184538